MMKDFQNNAAPSATSPGIALAAVYELYKAGSGNFYFYNGTTIAPQGQAVQPWIAARPSRTHEFAKRGKQCQSGQLGRKPDVRSGWRRKRGHEPIKYVDFDDRAPSQTADTGTVPDGSTITFSDCNKVTLGRARERRGSLRA
jgi:hypothetical protein